MNEYLKPYKHLICDDIDDYLTPKLNTTLRKEPFWYIGYLTEYIDGIPVTENTRPITKESAELIFDSQVKYLYFIVNSSLDGKYISPNIKYMCVLYIILEGLELFQVSKLANILKTPRYPFTTLDFYQEFNRWIKTKEPSLKNKIKNKLKNLCSIK